MFKLDLAVAKGKIEQGDIARTTFLTRMANGKRKAQARRAIAYAEKLEKQARMARYSEKHKNRSNS